MEYNYAWGKAYTIGDFSGFVTNPWRIRNIMYPIRFIACTQMRESEVKTFRFSLVSEDFQSEIWSEYFMYLFTAQS